MQKIIYKLKMMQKALHFKLIFTNCNFFLKKAILNKKNIAVLRFINTIFDYLLKKSNQNLTF